MFDDVHTGPGHPWNRRDEERGNLPELMKEWMQQKINNQLDDREKECLGRIMAGQAEPPDKDEERSENDGPGQRLGQSKLLNQLNPHTFQ